MSSSKKNEVKKLLFTPCRSVGLRRKSSGSFVSHLQKSKLNSAAENYNKAQDCNAKKSESVSPDQQTSVTKKLKTDTISADILEANENCNSLKNTNCKSNNQISDLDIDSAIKLLEKNIENKSAKLKNLESESLNMKQHDLETLNSLIKKWRDGCQIALHELLNEHIKRGKNCTMIELINLLGIPQDLIHYSEAEMDFYD